MKPFQLQGRTKIISKLAKKDCKWLQCIPTTENITCHTNFLEIKCKKNRIDSDYDCHQILMTVNIKFCKKNLSASKKVVKACRGTVR